MTEVIEKGTKSSEERRVIPKGEPIIIPNADQMTPEELKRAKHAEKMRRYQARKNNNGVAVVKEKKAEIRKMDTAEMVEMAKDTRNLAIRVLNNKLIMLETDEEELKKTNMATLATVFGILYDKAALAAGMATENIAIHSKIDINITSDKALDELNRMRERFNQEHNS